MKSSTPAVRDCMSHLPTEIDRRESISKAARLMRDENIRHLPVMDGARLFGVISSRDLDVIMVAGGEQSSCTVGQVCVQEPLMASPVDSVVKVAEMMLEQRVGSTVIVDGGVVVGIFTATDALKALVTAYS